MVMMTKINKQIKVIFSVRNSGPSLVFKAKNISKRWVFFFYCKEWISLEGSPFFSHHKYLNETTEQQVRRFNTKVRKCMQGLYIFNGKNIYSFLELSRPGKYLNAIVSLTIYWPRVYCAIRNWPMPLCATSSKEHNVSWD